MHKAKRDAFRAILGRRKLTIMPGGFSPLYAQLAEATGFECFFLAGSQVSAYLLGLPDTGLITLRDMADHARHVAARTTIPIMVDADTGYGNAVNAYFAVKEIIATGAAALSIEDQEAPKKSGTLAGRRCIAQDEAVSKYRAAIAARNELDPSFVVCARVDAIGAEGLTFSDALARGIAYARDGGVDLVWMNSVADREQLRAICKEIPAPVLISYAGKDGEPSNAEYEALGARIAIHPTIISNVGLQAAWTFMHDFRQRGAAAIDDWEAASSAAPAGRLNRRTLLKDAQIRELEEQFLTNETRRDYLSTGRK